MARKRYQKGHVYLDGDNWKGRYREDVIACGETVRRRPEVILGSKRELPTKRLAERRMEVVLARVNGLHYRPSRVATLSGFVDSWKVEVLSKQKTSSVRALRSHLKCYILPELGKLRLEEFGVENQQRFVTRVSEKGVSRKTTLNVLGTLSSILSTARDWGYTCEQIKLERLRLPPRSARYEAPHFTVDQIRKILSIAEEPWKTLYCILTMEGLRAGEPLGLQWRDFDFDRKLLHIRRSAWYGKIQTTKSQASDAVLPIPSALVEILQQYRANWTSNADGFLFVTRNGRPPSSNKVVEYHLWTLWEFRAVAFTRSATRTPHYSSTAELRPKSRSVSSGTPMLAQPSIFTGMWWAMRIGRLSRKWPRCWTLMDANP